MLTNTGRAEQVDDEPLAFASDEVIKAQFLVMSLDKRLEEVLEIVRKDKVLKRFVIPLDILNPGDIKLHCIATQITEEDESKRMNSRHILSDKLNPETTVVLRR
jgi:hypothetical protein